MEIYLLLLVYVCFQIPTWPCGRGNGYVDLPTFVHVIGQ